MKRGIAIFLSLVLLFSFQMTTAKTEGSGTFEMLDRNAPPAFATERTLTDDQITGLNGAGLDQLKKKIATFGDLIAWIRIDLLSRMQFVQRTTSNEYWQYTFGADFSYMWLQSWFSPNMIVSIAQYVLEDDYPGIETVCVFSLYGNDIEMKCAVSVPMDGGYYIMNPEWFIFGEDDDTYNTSCAFEHMLFVSGPEGILSYYQEQRTYYRISQILVLDSADEVVLDRGESQYVPKDLTHVTTVYYNEEARYPSDDTAPDFSEYGFPDQLGRESEIGSEAARTIEQGTYEDASGRIRTIPDVLNYLYFTSHYVYGSNLSFVRHDGEWCCNLKPNVVFRMGKSNCGGISGLIAGLLEGDYDEVGMIYLRFLDGGHVINYVRDRALFYVFDANSWTGCNYYEDALSFSYGPTLEDAAMQYSRKHDVRQMVAYVNPRGGDSPVMLSGNETKLPDRYCEYTVLQETPEEGFVFRFVDYDPAVIEAIDLIRGTW